MINKHFRRNLLLQRFSGVRGWLAFLVGLCTIIVALLALPILIILGAITFLFLSIFGRVYLKKKMTHFQQAQQAFQQAQNNEKQTQSGATPFEQDGFTPKPRQGRTFEHDPH